MSPSSHERVIGMDFAQQTAIVTGAASGMGRLTINAVYQQDFPLVLGSVMFFAVLTIIGYLLTDIFYALVDPRVRLS